MNNRKTVWLSVVAAVAFGLVGCDSSSSGETGSAMVNVIHLAPEVPSADDTRVDILVNDTAAIEDLAYGAATGRVMLDAGMYTFGVAVAGSTQPVVELSTPLADGQDLTVVAYRDPMDVVALFVFDNSTDALEAGKGRVFVGHGADDSLLDPVDIVVVDGDACSVLIPGFVFGTTAPAEGVLDLDEGTVNIGFDITGDCTPDAGPVEVLVAAGVVSVLVAVDEDTMDESLGPELWANIDAADTAVRLINTP